MCRPSCDQVICSTSSSSVPIPPGRATKASAFSNIRRLRVCMSGTTMVSWTSSSMLLAGLQEIRNDSGHMAAIVQHGAGDRAHQADIAAAIDEPDAGLGDVAAERFRGLGEDRVGPESGAAIDADGCAGSLIDAGRAGQGQGRARAGSWRAALTVTPWPLRDKRRKLPKSAALKVWIRLANARAGRTAVAASGLAALAAVVIWFGILPRTPEPRRSPPGGETSAGRGRLGTPEARPAQPAPAATAPPAETRRAEPPFRQRLRARRLSPSRRPPPPPGGAGRALVRRRPGRAERRERDRRTGGARARPSSFCGTAGAMRGSRATPPASSPSCRRPSRRARTR